MNIEKVLRKAESIQEKQKFIHDLNKLLDDNKFRKTDDISIEFARVGNLKDGSTGDNDDTCFLPMLSFGKRYKKNEETATVFLPFGIAQDFVFSFREYIIHQITIEMKELKRIRK